MNIKQFLKPDWRKIVLFVIIFLLSPFLENVVAGDGIIITRLNFLYGINYIMHLVYTN